MGNSSSGLENDSETEEEEDDLAEGVREDESDSVDDQAPQSPQSRGLASRAGKVAGRQGARMEDDGDNSLDGDAPGEATSGHKWHIESPSTGARSSSRWNEREEKRASPPGQAHESSGRGRGPKSGSERRGGPASTPAGVMVQQEPEGSPFRQQSSQPPLEPQQHGPPALALPQSSSLAAPQTDLQDAPLPQQRSTVTPSQDSTPDVAQESTAGASKDNAFFRPSPSSSRTGHGQAREEQALNPPPRGPTVNGAIIPSSSRGSTISTTGSHSFGCITTELLLAAASSLSSHPFLHRPFTLPHDLVTEFYIIRHGEASHNVSSLIGGRSHDAPLTELGEQQAMLLGKFLRTYTNLEFDAIYSSPIERSLRTAHIVCKELGVSPSAIQLADALQELSQGKWEQQPRKSIYKEGVLERMTAAQPDFRAPGGESQRQVEFRMVEFINSVLFSRQHMALGDDSVWTPPIPEEVLSAPDDVDSADTKAREAVQAPTGERAGSVATSAHKQDGASRGEQGTPGTSQTPVGAKSVFRIAVFSHGTAIRCLMRGVMSWDPHLTHKVAIDNTSITLLKHTVSRGWHLVKLNDTAHLVLARRPLNSD